MRTAQCQNTGLGSFRQLTSRNLQYEPRISEVCDHRDQKEPVLTIVVVGYRSPDLLSSCLNSLREQTRSDFEVIVVDNGGSMIDDEWREGLSVAGVRLKKNYYQIIARNIGASFSRSGLLFFLDEDCLLGAGAVKEIVRLYETTDVIASRCRLFCRTKTIFNRLAAHYDLGDEQISGYLLESGMTIRTDVYRQFGGYDETLVPGGEYMYWLYNIGKNYGLDRAVYFPGAMIWTDYCRSVRHFIWKHWTYAKGVETIRARFPEFLEFRNQIASQRPKVSKRNPFGIRVLRLLTKTLFWFGERYYRFTMPKVGLQQEL
jgi:glycosyltransferase involved in cell wall biosynthesis